MTKTNFLKDIESQALRFLRDYAFTAYIFFIITHSFLAKLIYIDLPSKLVLFWLFSFFCIETITLFYRRRIPSLHISRRSKLFKGMLVNILDGAIVASCLFFFPYVEQGTQMIIITMLLIACTGAITTTIGYQKFYRAFTIPIFIAIFFASLNTVYLASGISGLILLVIGTTLTISVLYQVSAKIFNNFKDAFSANLQVTQINEELQSAIKVAKRANASKTRFLASASHDLRQPINVLSLFVANLTLKDSKGEYSDIVNHMNTAINSVDAQLESLLDISKLDAGIVDVKLKEVNLAKVTEELVSLYPNSDSVKINYISNIEDLIVDTDTALFERVINNLISNAVKYTNEGYIEINLKSENGRAVICVKDTGIGIKPTELENIFEEFYQINNSERNSEKGLGLGLSIVKRLTDLLDIEISLNSQYGLGTEVIISMDYKRASKPNIFEIEAASIASGSDSKRILVLDNEIEIVIALKAVLETMNHQVETFTCSNKALRCFEKRKFDLALIDYRLSGGVRGDNVIKRMLSTNSRTKFFLVTGDNNIQTTGHFSIIHKPVTSKKLELILNA